MRNLLNNISLEIFEKTKKIKASGCEVQHSFILLDIRYKTKIYALVPLESAVQLNCFGGVMLEYVPIIFADETVLGNLPFIYLMTIR